MFYMGRVISLVHWVCFHFVDLNEALERPVPELLLKVGEPLLIRCKAVYSSYKFKINWSLANKALKQVIRENYFHTVNNWKYQIILKLHIFIKN